MRLDVDGAELADKVLSDCELSDLKHLFDAAGERPGARISGDALARSLVAEGSTLLHLACASLGPAVRPVRIVLFDKTPARNWGVAWHQDRTVAVAERIDTPGFGPWSCKAGVQHVEPPSGVLAEMLTVRAHLDLCDDANAPLVVACGSHRIGLVAANKAAEVAARFEPAICLAKPGQVWLYRTPILHTSRPAERPGRRRVMQVDFAVGDLPGGLVWAGV